MPPLEEMDRHQYAVLWPFLRYNGDGEAVVDEPVELLVRWEDVDTDKRARMMGPDGNLVEVLAMVVVERDVPVHSAMWKGRLRDYSDAYEQQVREVVAFNDTPDLKGRFTRRVCGLMFYQGAVPEVTS